MLDDLNLVQKFLVLAFPVVLAITVHEYAHGWVANKLGDPTARNAGRLTLNPLSHIDIVGTVIVPTALFFVGGFLFGWAKPVPVDWRNLQRPKTDMVYVAIAGPLANLLMALVWLAVIRLGFEISAYNETVGRTLGYFAYSGIFINLVLMVINLLPIPPLDGGRVLTGLLPGKLAWYFARLEPLGLPIMVALVMLGWLGAIIGPVIFWLQRTLYSLAGVI